MKTERFGLFKFPIKTASLLAAIGGWLLLSALSVFIVWAMRDRARLIRDNENEQLFNSLFTGLRDSENFGESIEDNPALKSRISGFAVYGSDYELLYSWGAVPPKFDESILGNGRVDERRSRYTIPDKKGDSVKFITRLGGPPGGEPPEEQQGRVLIIRSLIRPDPDIEADSDLAAEQPGTASVLSANEVFSHGRTLPPLEVLPPVDPHLEGAPPSLVEIPSEGAPLMEAAPSFEGVQAQDARRLQGLIRRGFPFLNTLTQGRYFYVDISHAAYRRTMVLTDIVLPLCTLALLAAALAVRRLYLRIHEYRASLEAQKNLVVLGTAASTLAHEIKNPLSAIRLQTGILRKVAPEAGQEEIGVIEEEVERLSALTYRMNDYLREAKGNPRNFNIAALLDETGQRLCGRSILDSASDAALVHADTERLRSVFENIIRNALESGGAPEEVRAEIIRKGENIVIIVNDRGRGINEKEAARLFDPFFTSKSSGTGIGLSISKRFVEAAGGSITLANREGGGAQVRISLPAAG